MKKINKLLAPVLIALLFVPGSSCLVEGEIELVVAYTFSDSWPIFDGDGKWEESLTVTYDDVIEDIDLSDTEILRVDIEGIGFNVQNAPAALNGAKNVYLKVKTPSMINSLTVVDNASFEKTAERDTVYVSDELVEAGVNAVKEAFEGYIFNTNSDPFTLTTTGESDPSGVALDMDLAVIIRLSIVTVESLEE